MNIIFLYAGTKYDVIMYIITLKRIRDNEKAIFYTQQNNNY